MYCHKNLRLTTNQVSKNLSVWQEDVWKQTFILSQAELLISRTSRDVLTTQILKFQN
ncbi:Uncharacterised protein [Mycobacterium tuberculosis]|nr:Uncharacterised protein [Mycobacterium tuberculosis]